MLRTLINQYLWSSILIFMSIGFLANMWIDWAHVKEFINKGERHTLEHAVIDCKYDNMTHPDHQRNCEELYK